MMAVCKSVAKDNLLWHIYNTIHRFERYVYVVWLMLLLRQQMWKGGFIHTGSFPSIASIHSRRLASDRACRVMTPCLREGEQHFADLICKRHRCSCVSLPSTCSLTSQPPQCQNRSVCRWNPAFFWRKSAAWTSPELRSPRRSEKQFYILNFLFTGEFQVEKYLSAIMLERIYCCAIKGTTCSVSGAKQRQYSHYQPQHCETLINW